MNIRHSDGGYTLSETLIVLAIFVLLISIGPNLYPSFTKGMENRLFLSQFHEDLFYAQQYAISHESLIYLHIDNAEKIYTVSSYKEGGRSREKHTRGYPVFKRHFGVQLSF